MLSIDNNTKAFLELVRAGLWEKEARLLPFNDIDYSRVLTLAEEQSVVGLVAAGLAHVSDVKVPKEDALQFVGQALQMEQRNDAMSKFTAVAVEKMRKNGLNPLLVKGQGIGQCYVRPQWRASGDIDFFFSKEDYPKAVEFFTSWSGNVVQDSRYTKSFGVIMGPWFIEIHGTLRSTLSSRQVKAIDAVQEDTFKNKKYRVWKNRDTDIYLPEANNDLIFVFTHFVRHFYKEGVCIRQLCDWCRLLWTFRNTINTSLLAARIKRMDLMDEWHAFSAMGVDYLGMPVDALPLYATDKKWHVKGEKIMRYILDAKRLGKIGQTLTIAKIFPGNTIKFSPSIFLHLNWLKIKERVFGDDNK